MTLERALLDEHGLADLELHLGDRGGLRSGLGSGAFGSGGFGLALFEDRGEHREDLVDRQRGRVVGVADESGDTRCVAHGAPRFVGQFHADEHVTGDADATNLLALAVLDLDDVFHRHLRFEDELFEVEADGAVLEVLLHAVLVAGVGVDDVPVTLLHAQLGLELLGRVDFIGGVAFSGVVLLAVGRVSGFGSFCGIGVNGFVCGLDVSSLGGGRLGVVGRLFGFGHHSGTRLLGSDVLGLRGLLLR